MSSKILAVYFPPPHFLESKQNPAFLVTIFSSIIWLQFTPSFSATNLNNQFILLSFWPSPSSILTPFHYHLYIPLSFIYLKKKKEGKRKGKKWDENKKKEETERKKERGQREEKEKEIPLLVFHNFYNQTLWMGYLFSPSYFLPTYF